MRLQNSVFRMFGFMMMCFVLKKFCLINSSHFFRLQQLLSWSSWPQLAPFWLRHQNLFLPPPPISSLLQPLLYSPSSAPPLPPLKSHFGGNHKSSSSSSSAPHPPPDHPVNKWASKNQNINVPIYVFLPPPHPTLNQTVFTLFPYLPSEWTEVNMATSVSLCWPRPI